ncbi:DUF4377 domain-containing protein [Nocardia sp. NPDC050712]|uniref:DUF4377 domain-containing protein n=1 Tax=Nocardia sp. NPDC050712 TaxID=3155518 RepID=UPI00340742CC
MQLRLCHAVLLGAAILPAAAACGSSAPAESPAKAFEVDVAHETMRCTETSEQRCLQIRRDPNGPWELCYDEIDGFDHDPGYRYHLRVEPDPAGQSAPDAARWQLVAVLDKQRVIPEPAEPPSNIGLDGPGLTGGRRGLGTVPGRAGHLNEFR